MRILSVCPLFRWRHGLACLLAMSPQQKELLSFVPPPGIIFVNQQVHVQTAGTQRVISVHGVIFAHYDVTDHAAEAYAMVTLYESGYADQNDVARAFGYATRTLRRYQDRLAGGGLSAIARPGGRPAGSRSKHSQVRRRDRMILHLKASGFGNRVIAGRLGLDEKAIRKRLRRLGWQPCPEPLLPFPAQKVEAGAAEPSLDSAAQAKTAFPRDAASQQAQHQAETEPAPTNQDLDPLNRSMDRLLAAMGLIQDAAPPVCIGRECAQSWSLAGDPTIGCQWPVVCCP